MAAFNTVFGDSNDVFGDLIRRFNFPMLLNENHENFLNPIRAGARNQDSIIQRALFLKPFVHQALFIQIPAELYHQILDNLHTRDIQRLSQTNRATFFLHNTVGRSWPRFALWQDIVHHASNLAETLSVVRPTPMKDVPSSILQRQGCIFCGDFATLVYLPNLTRICHYCLSTDARLTIVACRNDADWTSIRNVFKKFLHREPVQHDHAIRAHPALCQFPPPVEPGTQLISLADVFKQTTGQDASKNTIKRFRRWLAKDGLVEGPRFRFLACVGTPVLDTTEDDSGKSMTIALRVYRCMGCWKIWEWLCKENDHMRMPMGRINKLVDRAYDMFGYCVHVHDVRNPCVLIHIFAENSGRSELDIYIRLRRLGTLRRIEGVQLPPFMANNSALILE